MISGLAVGIFLLVEDHVDAAVVTFFGGFGVAAALIVFAWTYAANSLSDASAALLDTRLALVGDPARTATRRAAGDQRPSRQADRSAASLALLNTTRRAWAGGEPNALRSLRAARFRDAR
jgi:hypothetical protein